MTSSFSTYNPTNLTQRGRVIESTTLSYQLNQAKVQALLKLEELVANLTTGTIALGTVSLVDGRVASITMAGYGSGYNEATTVVSLNDGSGGSGLTVSPVIDSNGTIQAINVLNGGSGYTASNKVEVTITGDGTGAIAHAVVRDGVVDKVNITEPGSDYKFPPLVSFNSPNANTLDVSGVAVLGTDEKVSSVTITDGGSGYSNPVFVEFASPETNPNLPQRNLLYEEYYKEFSEGIAKPTNRIQQQKTESLTTITNPLISSGMRDIQFRLPPPEIPEIIVPDEPSDSFFTVRNDGKLPSQESRYTHNKRIDRNTSTSYLLDKANQTVADQVTSIVKNGGSGAILEVGLIGGGVVNFLNIVNGGSYYTINTLITVRRTQSDPGKLSATAVVDRYTGAITSVIINNPTTNIGYVGTHPPSVIVTGNAVLRVDPAHIGGIAGTVSQITIVDGGSGYSYQSPPTINVERIKGDPGLAFGIVTSVVTTDTADHGKITGVSMTEAGYGYNYQYPPTIRVSNGKGSVSDTQKESLLKDAINNAFQRLNTIEDKEGELPNLSSTISIPGSFGIIKKNRNLNIVDVDDPLLRFQRLEYKNQENIINSKAQQAALSRYNKAIEEGLIPNVPAIPPDPVLPTITLTSLTGSGAILKPIVNFPGKVSGVEIIEGGSDYPQSPPIVEITGGGLNANGSTAYAVVESGSVSEIRLLYGGVDYTEEPTVSITGGGGSGADFTANVTNFSVSSFSQVSGGSNYLTITFTGGGGSGALGLVHTYNSSIIGVEMIDMGSGYNLKQPPNSIYLEYLRQAETTVEDRERQDPNFRLPLPPPRDELPNPTLEPSKDKKGFYDNQSIEDANAQRRSAKRANSNVIYIAQTERKEAYDAWNTYQGNKTSNNLKLAYEQTTIAAKATLAAQNLKNFKISPNDPYMKHKIQVYNLYRDSIPAWVGTNTYSFGDLIEYEDEYYRVLYAHRPADFPIILGTYTVNPVSYLNIYYQKYKIFY